ncbi:MAG: hypothetical protein O3C57_07495 [Verrucomicrobia bacterium]|nr:hypothetical protein [Verrucomicrobiota bacterium]
MSRLSFFKRPEIWLLLLLGLASAITGWFVGKSVYCSATITWDESSYLFQSYIFSEGKVKRPAPELAEELERGKHLDTGEF